MGLVLAYVLILPAVILLGWIASWWGTRRMRWIGLSVAAAASVVCAVIGQDAMGPRTDPHTLGCASALECTDLRPAFVIASGLLGFVVCLALVVLTLVAEFVVSVRRKVPARPGL
ncbi:hypothetical protein [Streptomyces sp. NBC_00102]|uniref:hypothetical protein n=1 Tax=Streptomyces sp. NBC_00102 TaxID=2975652 RepID=UPI002252340B|nr:hypothetical protein [Streptomyces sp. NBC_00102]MCX5398966.1 hypothetical protein [Streptomyces sp. NBC_00102]